MNTEHKVIEVVGGIIRRGDKYLLVKRPLGKSLGGHWEFIAGRDGRARLLSGGRGAAAGPFPYVSQTPVQ